MEVAFNYDKEKDIWCLLNKGKSSNNSSKPTKVYELLTTEYGENPTEEDVSSFIDDYLVNDGTRLEEYINEYQAEWKKISVEYAQIAEKIFKTSLPDEIRAYLTVNNRNPYSISEKYFYVTIPRESIRKTALHELWHFYTWYGLGEDQEERLGKKKYNELKEALTVLLNVECNDLFPEGVTDVGYPQHKQIRSEILKFWAKEKDIFKLWEYLIKSTD